MRLPVVQVKGFGGTSISLGVDPCWLFLLSVILSTTKEIFDANFQLNLCWQVSSRCPVKASSLQLLHVASQLKEA
ncbi:hypothetical protein FOCC_FOCC013363 [Frankliniella occidentalis]|nr:hypothetical protein FOCC_FOCC013363 [Frankliniella occidentalis]